jgi:hypothetical protein
MIILLALVCPTGCSSAKLEPLFDDCTPSLKFGEIQEIAVAANDFAGFTDITNLTEWDSHIAAGDIEILTVKGTMGEPDREEYEGPKGRTFNGQPTFEVPFEIWDITDENWEMMRQTYCNTQHKVWLLTKDYCMGGIEGLENAAIKMHVTIDEGFTSVNKIIGSVKFKADTVPEKTVNPGDFS